MSNAHVLRALVTVREMLSDRGCALGDLEAIGADEVAALCSQLDTFHLQAGDTPIVVILRKLRNCDIVKAAAALDSTEARARAILLTPEALTSINRRCVAECLGSRAECFSMADLQLNVSRHKLVPTHELLAQDEVAELLRALMLKSRAQLPSILRSDPMARYVGCFPGDVVRILRPSPTAGESVAYRHCRAET
jgi:DNA-directed RNA polymerase subunit H (RpoH/RPB5)